MRPVVANGRPVQFEWNGPATATPVGITLITGAATVRDTLRFDGAGRAALYLPVGRHSYQLDGGGTGTIAVDRWSEEWLPHTPLLSTRETPSITTASFTSSRSWIWLFGLAIAALAGEWFCRRRLGLR